MFKLDISLLNHPEDWLGAPVKPIGFAAYLKPRVLWAITNLGIGTPNFDKTRT